MYSPEQPPKPFAARRDDWMLSLIVPVMNEQDNIGPFLEAVWQALGDKIPNLEVLFVDDGSRDLTLQRLREAAQADSRVRYVSFSRNFGKEVAMTAGIDHARGDAVVPIDVDLQHPPATVLEFVRLWRDEGYDMVYGIRHEANDETAAKKATSGLFYRVFNRVAHTEIPPSAGDFRLLDRRVVEAMKQLPERNRFMKGLYSWVGFRSIGIPYRQPPRLIGKSRFNYWKLWNFALDGLVSFSTWPLRVWSYIGAVVSLLSFIYIVIIVAKTLMFGSDTPGYASVMSAVLFFGGMQLLSMGVLGEYVARLFVESKQRPLYLVSEVSDLPATAGVGHAPVKASAPAAPPSATGTGASVERDAGAARATGQPSSAPGLRQAGTQANRAEDSSPWNA